MFECVPVSTMAANNQNLHRLLIQLLFYRLIRCEYRGIYPMWDIGHLVPAYPFCVKICQPPEDSNRPIQIPETILLILWMEQRHITGFRTKIKFSDKRCQYELFIVHQQM